MMTLSPRSFNAAVTSFALRCLTAAMMASFSRRSHCAFCCASLNTRKTLFTLEVIYITLPVKRYCQHERLHRGLSVDESRRLQRDD